jgi:hypothetical protein
MATFQAPSDSSGTPPVLPEGDPDQTPLGFRLFRYYRSRPAGRNVYYRESNGVGSVTETDPQTTYDSNGNILIDGWSDIAHVWWGGHAAETVTATQATALTNAGYTLG